MAAFATADDLANRLGIDMTASEQTDAGTLLTLASDLIRDETGQAIERVTDDTLTMRGSRQSSILLPERPVESVTSVTFDGEVIGSDFWYIDGDELVRKGTFLTPGLLDLPASGWGYPGVELEIVYTHGYATIPAAVKAVCLEMAVRVWANPGDVRSESIGSEQTTYPSRFTSRGSEAPGLLILRAEAAILKRALRRKVGSVNVL